MMFTLDWENNFVSLRTVTGIRLYSVETEDQCSKLDGHV